MSFKKLKTSVSDDFEIAYSGHLFSYTYLAAKSVFSRILIRDEATKYISCNSLKEVFDIIVNGDVTYGVVPIESSSNGTLHSVYDNLLASNGSIAIVGEIGLAEEHCLCTKLGISSELDIERVVCHPHILECCSDFLDELDNKRKANKLSSITRIASCDSAAACELVSTEDDKFIAAIGSKEAAQNLGLKILKAGVGNDLNAETRYIIVSRKDTTTGILSDPLDLSNRGVQGLGQWQSKKQLKRSIVVALKNAPGAIFKMSSCFALRDIDILKIESRPANTAMKVSNLPLESRPFTHKHWDLIFYIDYEPSANAENNENCIANLKEYSLWIRELGEYRAGLRDVDAKPACWRNMVDLLSVAL